MPQREAAADRLSARLAEEVAKTTALRNDLAALTQQQVGPPWCWRACLPTPTHAGIGWLGLRVPRRKA